MRDLRRQYSERGLIESELSDDPLDQLRIWFGEAAKTVEVDWQEPNAATLATSNADGYVTARIILLKGIDEGGLVFFTNYDSLKGQQLAENPRAAVVIFWPHVERQVRVEGRVNRITRTASLEYFHSRPRGSQIGAAISTQSSVIADRAELDRRADSLQKQLGDDPVPMPDNWGGYRLEPSVLEFWQGRENRLHDRIRYRRQHDQWLRERLAP
jgi:pyridoxamine 5'-phosphate oxidase